MKARYPKYAEKGPAWCRSVPAHWDVLPLMALGSESKRKNQGLVEQNLLSLSYGHIISKDINSSEGLLPESFETYQIVEPDDIVFRFTDLQNDKRSLRTARVRERGIITSAYMAFTPHRILPAYFEYVMRAYDLTKVFYGMGGGLRQSLRYEDVRRLPVLVPPPPEQRAIADFVDRETAKIDALIAKQNEMVWLLRERRESVIATSVTRGLRPSADLVERGITWQGPTPANWSAVPLRSLLRLQKIPVGNKWASTTLLSLTKRGVITRDIDSGEGKFPASFETYQSVEPGDLVLCLFDMDETPRTVGLAHQHGMVTGAYTRFKVNRSMVSPEYLESAFIAIDDGKRFRPLYTGLRKVVQKSRLLSAKLALPPLDEQRQIVDHIDRETAKIDALIAKAEEHIALAQERRAALITAAVTGQLDVTGKVA